MLQDHRAQWRAAHGLPDWSCPRCSFCNCGHMPTCEMCEQLRPDHAAPPTDEPNASLMGSVWSESSAVILSTEKDQAQLIRAELQQLAKEVITPDCLSQACRGARRYEYMRHRMALRRGQVMMRLSHPNARPPAWLFFLTTAYGKYPPPGHTPAYRARTKASLKVAAKSTIKRTALRALMDAIRVRLAATAMLGVPRRAHAEACATSPTTDTGFRLMRSLLLVGLLVQSCILHRQSYLYGLHAGLSPRQESC